MRALLKLLFPSFIFACVAANPGNSFASQITPAQSDADFLKLIPGKLDAGAGQETADLLRIRAPNSSGISINRFLSFNSDRPLKIINVPRESASLVGEPAKLVVLVVNSSNGVKLSSSIDLVGPPTDLLILTHNDGANEALVVDNGIQCEGCTVNNVYRLAFAAALSQGALANFIAGNAEYDSVTHVGSIATFDFRHPQTRAEYSQAIINNLNAPGALSVDVLAENVMISGVNTHHRANRVEGGGFQNSNDGNYLVGGGQVLVVAGAATYDYELQKVTGFLTDDNQYRRGLTVQGDVSTSGFLVFSNRESLIAGNIVTAADIVSTVRYENTLKTAEEKIAISNFADGARLTIQGTLKSNAAVNVSSAGELVLADGYITGSAVALLAKNEILNKAKIESDLLSVAGGDVINQNKIVGVDQAEIWSARNVTNEYGGVIASKLVKIQADNGIVRNGARCAAVQADADAIRYDEGCNSGQDFTSDRANPDSMIEYGTASASWGTTDNGQYLGDRPQVTHAHILGRNIYIKSAALENINPYWKHVNAAGKIVFERPLMTQVSISAEDGLFIENREYTLNSSAIMQTNASDSLLSIVTDSLINERFRVVSLLNHKEVGYSEFNAMESYNESSALNVEGFFFDIYTYSPPGIIHSMGDFQAMGASFLNNTSYFEIFGDARFAIGKVNVIGIELTSTERGEYWQSSWINNGSCLDVFACMISFEYGTVGSGAEYVAPGELDSLFYVQGDAIGEEDALYVHNAEPFATFLSNVKNDIRAELYDTATAWIERKKLQSKYSKEDWRRLDYSISNDIYTMTATYRYFECSTLRGRTSCGGGSRIGESFSISLWDRLYALYQTAVDYVEQLLLELDLDWWN